MSGAVGPRRARRCGWLQVATALSLALLLPAVAAAAGPPSPHAGEEARGIKALSPEEVSAFLAGEGMGFARAAELNGYPGPAHVLELAAELGLTPEQKEKTRALFREMQASAVDLGEELIEAERVLDGLFASRSVTGESLAAATARVAGLQGRLRRVHLEAHVEQTALLTREQIERYERLRGYRQDGGHAHRY